MGHSMTIPQPLLAALQQIAEQLQTTSITWAVTGSCSLALQGLPVVVHDIESPHSPTLASAASEQPDTVMPGCRMAGLSGEREKSPEPRLIPTRSGNAARC